MKYQYNDKKHKSRQVLPLVYSCPATSAFSAQRYKTCACRARRRNHRVQSGYITLYYNLVMIWLSFPTESELLRVRSVLFFGIRIRKIFVANLISGTMIFGPFER